MIKNSRFILTTAILAVSSLLLSSCKDTGILLFSGVEDTGMVIDKLEFSPDYKNVVASATLCEDYGKFFSIDDGYKGARVYENWSEGTELPEKVSMQLDSVRDVTSEKVKSLGLSAVVLVDLTLPQEMVNREKEALKCIRTTFNDDNLFVSFLQSGRKVGDIQLLTDFLLENDFVEDRDGVDKGLYSGIASTLKKMDSNQILIVMSDGCVWGNGEPFDPEHFVNQKALNDYCSDDKAHNPIIYADFNPPEMGLLAQGSTVNNTVLNLCACTGGLYQPQFRWAECIKLILERYGVPGGMVNFYMTNPDGRRYSGEKLVFHAELRTPSDSLLMSGSLPYCISNANESIIVNGSKTEVIIVRGLVLGLLVALLIFVIFQYVEPRIRYIVFKKKYIHEYVGPNMTVGGISVADSCYLCKAPFAKGDRIVAKCAHTMHKDCWDENHYHCPDYRGHCHTGSHYYNTKNISDLGNARPVSIWIYAAVASAIVSWLLSYIHEFRYAGMHTDHSFSSIVFVNGDAVQNISSLSSDALPEIISISCFILLFSLCLLVVRHRQWWRRLLEILLRSLSGAAVSYAMFSICNTACSYIGNEMLSWIIYTVPWIIQAVVISYCISIGTSVRPRKYWMVGCVLVAAFVIALWISMLINTPNDYRYLSVLYYMLFNVGVAICVARIAPQSNRYVLHTEGCMKTTDIALYKYFLQNQDAEVMLGKSIACDIRMSWDVKGEVAPVQAVIFQKGSAFYLKAMEEGITLWNGKNLEFGRSVKLFHSARFTIGSTTFTFTEMDVY